MNLQAGLMKFINVVGRLEPEAKRSKRTKAGLRNIISCLFRNFPLPTPDFGLLSLATKVSIKIAVEPRN
jgi:hypothetical protein